MFYAKKSLGQNFLNSTVILDEIVGSAEINTEDVVLEIGPGEGSLTKKLLEKSNNVIALEKDRRLIPILKEKLSNEISSGKLHLSEADVKSFDIKNSSFQNGKYKIVANIPYYLTGLIIRKFLESEIKPSLMVLLVQKEVAERIIAKDGKESLLSLSVKAFGDPTYIKTVSKNFFKPQPKVDSTIIKIDNISSSKLKGIEPEKFFKILKAGFSSKRKKLSSNLTAVTDKKIIENAFEKIGLDKNTRSEEVPLEKWIKLCSSIS